MLGTGGGDRGAIPSAARTRARQAKEVSVSARQSAEKTIAALVAAMKDLPRRPDPPKSALQLSAGARRGVGGRSNPDGPAPIDYKVVWPASSEPEPARRVDLAWPERAVSGAVSLRWDDTAH